MDAGVVLDWGQEALRITLVLGGPVLLGALLVTLATGVLQTITQLHEPVVGLVPRLVVVVVVVALLLPWLTGVWVDFTSELISSIPQKL